MLVLTLHPVALACVAILSLLIFGLGLAVSVARGKAKVLIGVTGDPNAMLNRLVRAHGNTTEYAPFLAILFLVHGALNPSLLILSLMVIGTAARAVFALGLVTAGSLSRPAPLRFVGALGTYVVGIWLSVLLFWQI
ncbi:MAPEG family protein [Aquabacterium sp.]|uniref:MAPEG family protein n=1 Tax=Aquabacterium sp. TaxID=1872578 RepID=UPI0035B07DA4